MAKTRSHRKRSSTMKYPRGKCCEATMHGINNWYEKMFEELGWMVLAKHKGFTDKVSTYKNSLQRLKTAIEQKIHKVYEADRKMDLEILHKNLMVLIDHAHKDF